MALSNCGINSGITRDCRDASPGLVELIITEKANFASQPTSASGILTNVASYLTTGKKYWSFEFEYGKANEVEDITTNTNGTVSNAQTFTLFIPKKQASVAQILIALYKQDLSLVFKDKNGKWRIYGEEFGVRVTKINAPSGAVGNDDSGYTITFTGEERTLANEVPSALVTLLKLPA